MAVKMYGIIYKITNVKNGKCYIGQTKRSLRTRLQEHTCNRKTPISKALNSLGLDNFTITQIDHAHSRIELDEKERFWIKFYDSMKQCKGYNLCQGGEGVKGLKMSDEVRLRMRNSHVGKGMGKDNPMFGKCGELNPYYGKKHNLEVRKKMSDYAKSCNRVYGNNPRSKKVICVETGDIFDCIKLAAENYGLSRTHLNNCCTGYRKTAGGYHWKYYE